MKEQELQSKLKTYRLNMEEYTKISEILGHPPQGLEWALFSALWSEHCSYKSSKVHLKKLFNKSPRVVQSFGENAGVVDLGEGERVAFKIESHNHPSYIEPYQGAATGVGGILRDIFTMGARPIALANYLCFGEPKADRMPALVDGVVRGIAGYGNCVGVPNVTGQTEFDPSYNNNILVNAMAVGLFRPNEKIFLSKANGPGFAVVYVGAKTGRDGVHGASMASEAFGAESAAKRPTVQIGDPFLEKLLIESCLEVMQENLVVAIQDMGAAGLTSSSFEMASKGGVGLDLHLDRVPLRDTSMTPEDIMLSESQERMLLICEPRNLDRLVSIFQKWNLDAVAIGEVKAEKKVRILWKGETLVDINPDILVEDAPQYQRPYSAWNYPNRQKSRHEVANAEPAEIQALAPVMRSVQGSSKKWIYRQYDNRVGVSTLRGCEDSVGILKLKDSGRWLGIVLGCRPHTMRTDAFVGGFDSVAFPALELAAKGFETLAVTDCLNFGNPEKPEIMSQFVAALDGMNAICREIQAPIISGNVSFYNETLGKNITSTPSTGLVGLRKSGEVPLSHFSKAGLTVSVARLAMADMSSPLAKQKAFAGDINAKDTAQFISQIRELVLGGKLLATRVVGKYGLSYGLARMAMVKSLGFKLSPQAIKTLRGQQTAVELFVEPLYEVILVSEGKLQAPAGLTVVEIGTTAEQGWDFGVGNFAPEQINDIYKGFHTGFEEGLGYV